MKQYIIAQRLPYEEPYHLHIQRSASIGAFSRVVDFYSNAGAISDIGRALRGLPSKIPGEYVLEYGSNNPAAKVHGYLLLRRTPRSTAFDEPPPDPSV